MTTIRNSSLLLLLLLSLFGSVTIAAADEAVGSVAYLTGEVWAISGASVSTLKAGTAVHASESIVTGKHGRIKLIMNDGSRVYLSRDSRINLEKYRTQKGSLLSGAFNLLWGKARFVVEKLRANDASFAVRTTTAVLGVRGTNFIVSVGMPSGITPLQSNPELPPLPTRALLEEGRLHLQAVPSGREAMLEPGHMAIISPAGQIDIRPFNKGELQEMESNVSEMLDALAPSADPEVGAPDTSGVTVPVVVRPPTTILGTQQIITRGQATITIQVPVAVQPPVIVEQPLR